ncbi:hypothetical protein Tco_0549205 [Tanacetum coccineum]
MSISWEKIDFMAMQEANCIKNPVFHSKTKHIEIRHRFIRDSYEKRLIQIDDWNGLEMLRMKLGFKMVTQKVNADGHYLVLLGEKLPLELQLLRLFLVYKRNTLLIGLGQPTEPQHIPTTTSPSNIEPIPIIASLSQPQKTHKRRKTKRPTKISQSSRPTTFVADETVHEEKGDNMERAVTIAASLDAEQDSGNIIRTQYMAILNEPIPQGMGSGSGPRCQDTILGAIPTQTRFERLSKQSNDLPLSGVNTPRSGEDRLKIIELMEICTKLSDRVFALENVKTAQDLEITSLNKRVKKLEKKKKARTPQLKRRLFKVRIESSANKSLESQGRYDQDIDVTTVSAPIITTARVSVSTAEPSTPPTTTIVIEDEDLTIAQTLMKIRKPNESGTRKAVPPSQHDLKYKGKAKMIELKKPLKKRDQIKFDEEVAKRLVEELEAELKEEERGELTIKERSRLFVDLMDKRKKHFAKLRAEKIRRKPPTKAQKRNQMSTYLRNMAGYKHTQVVEGSGKKTESSRKETVSKKRAAEELDEESTKRQKLEDDAEKAELQLCLEIVPRDDKAVNVKSLSIKYSTVDWKTHILAEDKMYYQIIRADRSEKYYKIYSAMLDDFDRQDVLDLYRLVKERFETASPKRYDRLLWGDLITLFEPTKGYAQEEGIDFKESFAPVARLEAV